MQHSNHNQAKTIDRQFVVENSSDIQLPMSIAKGYMNSECIVSFVLGVGLYIHVYYGVRFSLSELLIPFVFLIYSGNIVRSYMSSGKLFPLYLLFLLSIYLSDLNSETFGLNPIKAAARVTLILLSSFAFGCILQRNRKSVVALQFGCLFGTILNFAFNTAQDGFSFEDAESGYAYFVFRVLPFVFSASICGLYLFIKRSRFLSLILIIGVGIVIMRAGSRSGLGCWLLYGSVIALIPFRNRDFGLRRSNGWAVAALLGALAIASFSLYEETAKNGLLGEQATEKFLSSQARGNSSILAMLMDGRTEVLALILMVRDQPFFGHGSNSSVIPYMPEAFSLVGLGAIRLEESVGLEGRGHSIVFSAWAFNGVLVLPFWIYVTFAVWRVAFQSLRVMSLNSVFFLHYAIQFSWSMLFSPLCVQDRFILGYLLSIYFLSVTPTRRAARSSSAVRV